MRLLTTALCLLLSVAAAAPYASAQDFVPAAVEISKEKVNVNGEIFYLHKVLPKQTLYSISKAYGIPVEVIQKVNPSLADGLKAGMLLYIPQTTAADTTAPAVGNSTKQTVEQTSEKPEAKTEKPQRTVKKKKYKKYNVKWYETLDDVAVKFNVTVDAIIALNDIDTASGKRIRGIMIPDKEFISSMQSGPSVKEDSEVTPAAQPEAQSIVAVPPGLKRTSGAYDDGPYVISVVLPFNASRLTGNLNAYAADFYAGVLTAAGQLKEEGLMEHFVINTVDLSQYDSSWDMIADGALKGSELIIGPISERDLQPVAAFAKNKEIPVVSPLDLNTASLADGNPYFYLFPPQSDLALSHQIDRISDNRHAPESSITVIYEDGTDSSELTLETFHELTEKGLQFNKFKYDFLSGRGIDNLMSQSLSPTHTNRVIIPSMNEAFITDALRNLNLIKSSYDYRIEVYGMSRWKSFETIESNYLHALDLRLAMSYYTDYNDSLTVEFINRYREAFNTEPTSFSYQGYDILTFFVEAMNTYGKDFPAAIINERKSLLQSDVLFLPVAPGSGCENRAFRDICFTKGWTVVTER